MLILTVYMSPLVSNGIDISDMINTSGIITTLDPSLVPEYDFTDLNETWYDHNIEMIIISPNNTDFINTLIPLKEWKTQKGVKTEILYNFSSYPGRDKPEQIRNLIKDFYEREAIRWVILAGDAQNDLIPIRYVYNPDTIDTPNVPDETVGDEYYKPTDFYYADLTGTWDDDNDGNFGESAKYNSQGIDEIDWIPEVYVGRLPASDYSELDDMVDKIIKYESNPEVGDWMNNMLLAGVISDSDTINDPDGEDESRLTEYIWKTYVESEMNFTHLYKTTYFSVNTSVDFSDEVVQINNGNDYNNYFNDGYSTVIFAGHGAPGVYDSRETSSYNIYTNTLASSFCSNTNMPSLIYADACSTASYDLEPYDLYNIGEILIKHQNKGAIGYIGGLRVTYYVLNDYDFVYLNRANAKLFWKVFFEDNIYQQGKALYDSKVEYLNSYPFLVGFTSMQAEYQRKNVLTYCLLGDPEVDIYTDQPLSASNPLPGTIYEGQLITITITDNQSQIVPYARVHLTTEDGKYSTVYADANGVAKVRVYPTANDVYNVTITGHNLVPTYYNFTTQPDTYKPIISDTDCDESIPTTLDNICFDVFASDNRSGIESAIVLIRDMATGTYTHYITRNMLYENATTLRVLLNKMLPGQYEFIIISRDYANNTQFYSLTYEFLIPVPLTSYILIGAIFLILLFSGSSVLIIYKGNKSYSKRRSD